MGNLNDNALPKLIVLLPDATETNDELLELLGVAVSLVAQRMSLAISLVITSGVGGADDSYEISPDYADSDAMWILIAQRAAMQYRENEFVAFRKQLGGMDTIANEVQRMSRSTTMRAIQESLKEAKAEFDGMVWRYKETGGVSIDTVGFRESA
jgi:hypothetical protein